MMKKVLFILLGFLFVLVSCKAGAQDTSEPDATVNSSKVYKPGYTYAKYTGTSTDVFTASRDTVDYVFNMRVADGRVVNKVAVGIVMDLTTTSDTLYEVTVFGEDFDDDDYTTNTVISASESAVITANNTFDVWESTYTEGVAGATDTFNADSTTTVAARTITPSMTLTWRKYVVRIIYSESGLGDATGTGLTLESMELKLCTN